MMNYAQIGIISGRRYKFEAEYETILAYAEAQGMSLPSDDQQIKQNQLVINLKSLGIWSLLDVFYMFATDAMSNGTITVQNFACINWINPSSYEATLVNAPTFTQNRGFNSNGSNDYFNTNYQLSNGVNFQQNDGSLGFYMFTGASAGSSNRPGICTTDGTRFTWIIDRGTNNVSGRMNSGTTNYDFTGISQFDSNSSYSLSRSSSTSFNEYVNGVSVRTVTNTSTGRPTSDVYIMWVNTGTFPPLDTHVYSSAWVGAGSINQLDLHNEIDNYIASL